MNGELEHGNESTVGSLLRASRIRREEDLVNVAKVLRVRLLYLEAIEESRYSVLPGNVYSIGFIRAYAEHLGLDSGEVVRRYKLESSGRENAASLIFPSPLSENRVPGGAILLIGVIITLITYGGWFLSSTQDGFLSGLIQPVPDRLVSMTGDVKPQKKEGFIAEENVTASATVNAIVGKRGIPYEKAGSEINTLSSVDMEVTEKAKGATNGSSPAIAKSVVLNKKTEKKERTKGLKATSAITPLVTPKEELKLSDISTDRSISSVAEQVSNPQTVDETTATSEAKSIKTKVEASSTSASTQLKVEQPARVEAPITPSPQVAVVTPLVQKELILLRAIDDSWILIRDGNTNQLINRKLLRAGETYRVPNRKGLTLEAGNAGALKITVDGKAVSAIGAVGAVLKNVALDATRLLEGTAVVQ